MSECGYFVILRVKNETLLSDRLIEWYHYWFIHPIHGEEIRMKKDFRNIPGFDDLLFESRNRDYGAYQLRKRYNAVLSTGIILASLLVSIAILLPFYLRPKDEKIYSGGPGGRYVNLTMEYFEPPEERIYIPPPPGPPSSSPRMEIAKYIPPVVVDTVVINEPQQVPTDMILIQEEGTPLDFAGFGGGGSGDDPFGGEFDLNAGGNAFFIVEVMPSFRGGDLNKFREWVQKRTIYPLEALEKKIEGKVFLTFIIEPDGAVTNVTVVKGVDPLLDDEAIKAIEGSPKWTPGLQRGQPVRVRYSMWLNFVI